VEARNAMNLEPPNPLAESPGLQVGPVCEVALHSGTFLHKCIGYPSWGKD